MSGTRRRILRLFLGLAVVAVLFLYGSIVTLADSGTGAANVSGTGSPSELISASPTTTSITLNGTNQTLTNTLVLAVTDATGSGNGWNLTLSATNFSGSGTFNGGTPTAESLATSGTLSITNVTVSCNSGGTCTNPTSTFTYPGSVAITTAATSPIPVKFYNAATGTGMGKFVVEPTLTIAVPANAYATTYSSTITLTVTSAP